MRNKDTAVIGVVFPGVEKFLTDYLISLEKQTYTDFDLIILNDGFNSFDSFKRQYNMTIIEIEYKNSPAKIREYALSFVKDKGYKYVIFTDVDDYFSPNRIEKSLNFLEHYDIVVNDLSIVQDNIGVIDTFYISNRINNLELIRFEFIIDKNIFGFSNTALRLENLSKISLLKELIAVDWFLFSTLLRRGYNAIFTNETVTYYRLHNANIVGLPDRLDERVLEIGIKVKLSQYKIFSTFDDRFKYLYSEMKRLKDIIFVKEYKDKYLKRVNSLNIYKPLWWELIKLPKEVEL